MKFNWVRSMRNPQRILMGGLALLCFQATSTNAAISVGNKSVLYVDADGEMFNWGANGSGQLGDDSKIDRLVPVVPAEVALWLDVANNLTGVANSTLEGMALN